MDSLAIMVGFCRAYGADHLRTRGFLTAVTHLGLGRADVYWAGRLTLCAGPDDLERYDRVFAEYFDGHKPPRARRTTRITAHQAVAAEAGDGEQDAPAQMRAAASEIELLRHRDLAGLTQRERDEVRRLLAALRPRPLRRVRRLVAAPPGRLDPGRTVRASLRSGGEIVRLRHRDRRIKPRRVVMLVDVSGSMSGYADGLLRFAHALVRGQPRATEVFSAGTRLTRLTEALRHREPGRAMAAVSEAIPDWCGGTRLGAELKEFLALYGRRGMARRAIVLIASDGWERGDVTLLADQMASLSRLAHRVIWVNPHKGKPGYEPLTQGMRAALPYIDDFVAGHSLATLEELAGVLTGDGRRTVAGRR